MTAPLESLTKVQLIDEVKRAEEHGADRIASLTDRNNRMADTLREARDQMIQLKDCVDDDARRSALLDALDYFVVGVDIRIQEIRSSVKRGRVGEDTDDARRIPPEYLAELFESALRARGYHVLAIPEAVQS